MLVREKPAPRGSLVPSRPGSRGRGEKKIKDGTGTKAVLNIFLMKSRAVEIAGYNLDALSA